MEFKYPKTLRETGCWEDVSVKKGRKRVCVVGTEVRNNWAGVSKKKARTLLKTRDALLCHEQGSGCGNLGTRIPFLFVAREG